VKVRCPRCGSELDVPDEVHYQQMPCSNCGGRFQAVTEATQEISREFIFEYLRTLEKKAE
jgi:hypothetical protein